MFSFLSQGIINHAFRNKNNKPESNIPSDSRQRFTLLLLRVRKAMIELCRCLLRIGSEDVIGAVASPHTFHKILK